MTVRRVTGTGVTPASWVGMTDCPDCLAAQEEWTWGGYHSSCEGCEIRAVAQSPGRIRKDFYARWLKQYGEEVGQEKRRAVLAEYQRIDKLREQSQ